LRGGDTVVHADQRLGARAEEAVDREGPAVRVAVGEGGDHGAKIGPGVDAGDEVPREHHLAEAAGTDRLDSVADDGPIAVGREGAGGEDGTRRGLDGSDGGQLGWRKLADTDAGQPEATLRPAHNDRGDDEHARGRRRGGERETAERDETSAGKRERVGDRGGGDDRVPGRRGIRHA
jgi:hypothetical protein